MKKTIILNILILLLILIVNVNNSYSKESKDYVLANQMGNRYEVGYPGLDDINGFKSKVERYGDTLQDYDRKYTPYYYTKSECLKKANESIDGWRDPKNKERKGYYYKVVDKYYAVSADVDNIYNIFCIPVKMWNKMKPAHKNTKNKINIEKIYKTNQSFAEVMKKCGFTAFDYDHINLHDTPFICDKYNENNPIPYVSYDEILSKKK